MIEPKNKSAYDLLSPILPGLLSRRFGIERYNIIEEEGEARTSVLVSGETQESVTRRVRVIIGLLVGNPKLSDGDALELVIHKQGECPPAEQPDHPDFPRLMHWVDCARYGHDHTDARKFRKNMLVLIRAKTR